MGGTSSSPAAETRSTSESPAKNVKYAGVSNEPESQCPVDHSKLSVEQLARFAHPFHLSSVAKKTESGPTLPEKLEAPTLDASVPEAGASDTSSGTVYDVYGQSLDKANLMPATPNQLPSPGQAEVLSTERAASTIPKGGSEDGVTWTYPSPQMFFNALRRKGKADDVKEQDMDAVVAVHNTMNERTWAEVTAWEDRFHCATCVDPKLLHFRGRPDDLSPAARWRMWVHGYPRPFDRHDWVIDRCGVEQARYIIDYYYRENGPDPIEIHVRPALDSPIAIFDRIRANISSLFGVDPAVSIPEAPTAPLASVPAHESVSKEEYDFLRTLTPQSIDKIADNVKEECTKAGEVLALCKSSNPDGKCEEANVSLNYCMARQICRPLADGFMNALESNSDEVKAYDHMSGCLERFHIMARRVMMEAAGVKQKGPEFVAHQVAQSASEA